MAQHRKRRSRRSANGTEAGTAEHSGFLPQHGTKGTAQYYDLSGQRCEAHGPNTVVRQILGGARNQQPGAAHLQACNFDGGYFTWSTLARGTETLVGISIGGSAYWGTGNACFRH